MSRRSSAVWCRICLPPGAYRDEGIQMMRSQPAGPPAGLVA